MALDKISIDPRLRTMIDRLEETKAAIELYDAEWRLVWLSDELKEMVGEFDDEKLGIGRHMIESVCFNEIWFRRIAPESLFQLALDIMPFQLHDIPGGADALFDLAWGAMEEWEQPLHVPKGDFKSFFHEIEPAPPPPMFKYSIAFKPEGKFPTEVECFHFRLHAEDGEVLGMLVISSLGLPASVTALLTRGDAKMLQRMADLYEPGRRQAAVLFTDLEASGTLSRRLPSAAYFRLISQLTTEIDRVVAGYGGIIGKHAGDGVSAYFLLDGFESASQTARAAIEAAREIRDVAGEIAKKTMGEVGSLNGSLAVNVGVHWGATLYMGQLVSGGRLEVTALGDEVNECARIQESATEGEALASKALIEHLSTEDAAEVGLDLDSVRYLTVSELPGTTEKARRDAGALPVTHL
jgi:class 3 adenylate cyclase